MTFPFWLIKFDMDSPSADSIEIKNLKVGVRVGVTDVELSEIQQVSICLQLFPTHSLTQLGDDITRTVDYYVVNERVKELAIAHKRRLIETLAEEIADMLLAKFNLSRVIVEIRKFILPDTDYVAVKLARGV